jgi:hypothetical protein
LGIGSIDRFMTKRLERKKESSTRTAIIMTLTNQFLKVTGSSLL